MKKVLAVIAFSISLGLNIAQAQSPGPAPAPESRARVIAPIQPDANRAPEVVPTDQATDPVSTASATEKSFGPARTLSPNVIRLRIADAQRLFKTRPHQTSLTSPVLDVVTVALLDQKTSRIHSLALSKVTLLTKGAELNMTPYRGTPVTLRVLRANGVNTAVTVVDNLGHSLTPLAVEFPIEHNGVFRELAYYTSAHPALLSPELARAGQAYVRSMIDLAVSRLREKGTFIAPNIVDVAEHLCLVEHVDHDPFRNENRLALFGEIYSLYSLNELETYRYSVSSAGAGGMVQMIPWAYNLERQRHPGLGLMPDFVAGMRNHSNALQAMLLYMQDTWNELAVHEDIKYALETNLPTP